jgi:hypothetical protein
LLALHCVSVSEAALPRTPCQSNVTEFPANYHREGSDDDKAEEANYQKNKSKEREKIHAKNQEKSGRKDHGNDGQVPGFRTRKNSWNRFGAQRYGESLRTRENEGCGNQ